MSDLFYVFGIALTGAALILSFVGLRSERFPSSRGLYAAGLALVVGLVAASCAFAIVLAREEADHRAHEIEEFRAEQAAAAEEEAAEEAGTPAETTGGAPEEAEPPIEREPGGGETLELTSPADGGLVFQPTELAAAAGEVTIDYVNPSPVPHNVAIEADGDSVAQGETVTDGASGAATADLEAGTYIFYCAVPGHREAGMEGTLTVK